MPYPWKHLSIVGLVWLGLAIQLTVARETEPTPVRFQAVDVVVDSGDSELAAYQVELTVATGDVAFVGVEGGAHDAFATPPYYDPAALAEQRLVLAALNTGNQLPSGATRVARVHIRVRDDAQPEFQVKLLVAANSDGDEIDATPTINTGVSP